MREHVNKKSGQLAGKKKEKNKIASPPYSSAQQNLP